MTTEHGRPESIDYPPARRSDTADDYHGVRVPDPYRWLEYDGPERDAWVTGERALMAEFAAPKADSDRLYERLASYEPDVHDGVPYRYGDRRFFRRSLKGKNYTQTLELLLDGSERLVLDPNTWSEDGSVGFAGRSISHKGTYIAAARSLRDNDRQHWSVIDARTGEELADTIPETHNTFISWLHDDSGFFYSRTLDDGRRATYFHRVGTDADTDTTLHMPGTGDTAWYSQGLSKDDATLFIYRWATSGPNSILTVDLTSDDKNPTELLRDAHEDSVTTVVHSDKGINTVMTTDDAPRGRLYRLYCDGRQEPLIDEADHVLTDADIVCGRIAATYSSGTGSYVKIFDGDGKLLDTITPPDPIGTVTFTYSDDDDPACYALMQSPIRPTTVFSYDILTHDLKLFHEPEHHVDPERYDVTLAYATSPDGTRVPLFVSRAKDAPKGPAPTLLYGYGGFGISLEPTFDAGILPWLEAGGTYVTAILRGGGEFGQEWHEAGKKLYKQNVFDDFIAAADSLIERGITASDLLVTSGGSNGGLLVAATMIQRPELMRAVMPAAGLLDMLRYDKEENAAAGIHWQSEYGTTADEAEFTNLLAYSPVHTITEKDYPNVYATVGLDDDRVLPGNTFKFIAALQAAQKGTNPILVDIESGAGHNLSGKERRMRRDAREFAYLFRLFGMTVPNTPQDL